MPDKSTRLVLPLLLLSAISQAGVAQAPRITSIEGEMRRVRSVVGSAPSCRRELDRSASCLETIGQYRSTIYPYAMLNATLSVEIFFNVDGRTTVAYTVQPEDFSKQRMGEIWLRIVREYGITEDQRVKCEKSGRCYVGDLLIEASPASENKIRIMRSEAF